MRCPQCDTPLPEGESIKFCVACGATLPQATARPFAKTIMDGSGQLSDQTELSAEAPTPRPRPMRGRGKIEPVDRPHPVRSLRGEILNRRFRVDDLIGEGGFGEVYRGEQIQMKRPVALKVLHQRHVRDANLIGRFRREAESAAKLRCAHTIALYDFDQTPDGVLFLAMELLKGRSLHRELMEGALTLSRVLHILDGVAESLAEAHNLGIVHRDIKPENIFLEPRPDEGDFVKVLDFGIAKIISGDRSEGRALTALGETVGTLQYMSPEQLMGKPLDGRSDLYSLGIVAFEMATGTLPFKAKTPGDMINLQIHTAPPAPSSVKPGLPASFDDLVLRLLGKYPADRLADAAELRRELRSLEESLKGPTQPAVAQPVSPGSDMPPAGGRGLHPAAGVLPATTAPHRRWMPLAVGVGVLLLLLALALTLGLRHAHGASPRPSLQFVPAESRALLSIDIDRIRQVSPADIMAQIETTAQPWLTRVGLRGNALREIIWASDLHEAHRWRTMLLIQQSGEPPELERLAAVLGLGGESTTRAVPGGPSIVSNDPRFMRSIHAPTTKMRSLAISNLLKGAVGDAGAAAFLWLSLPPSLKTRVLRDGQLPVMPAEVAAALRLRESGFGADLRLLVRTTNPTQASELLVWARTRLAAAAQTPEVRLMGLSAYLTAIQLSAAGAVVHAHLPMDGPAYRGFLERVGGLLATFLPSLPQPSHREPER